VRLSACSLIIEAFARPRVSTCWRIAPITRDGGRTWAGEDSNLRPTDSASDYQTSLNDVLTHGVLLSFPGRAWPCGCHKREVEREPLDLSEREPESEAPPGGPTTG
jgi:hypothetical protein